MQSVVHPPSESAPTIMACMEVWGGNQATERSLSMLGLEASVYSRPYQAAAGGGDVYFISSCATGRITRLLVADISGHGAAVAEAGERLRALMRRHVNHIEQRQFLAELNREFGAVRHGGGFATAVAASFFSPDGLILLTNAGHPPPLVYSAAARRWAVLEPRDSATGLADLPLGMLDEMDYGELQVDAAPGDVLVFYTDSLIEAKHADGRLLGPAGLLQTVASLDPGQGATWISELLRRIGALHPDNLHDDDVTVLAFRPTGRQRRLPLRNRLAAPWIFLRGCWRAIRSRERLPLPEFTWANLGGSLFDRWGRWRRRHGG